MLSFFFTFLYTSWNSLIPLVGVPLPLFCRLYDCSAFSEGPVALRGCTLTISDNFHELVASMVLGFNVAIHSSPKESTRRYFPFQECLVTTNAADPEELANVGEAIVLKIILATPTYLHFLSYCSSIHSLSILMCAADKCFVTFEK